MHITEKLMLVSNLKPIYFLGAGVGYNFANWMYIPGISKIMYGVNILYDEQQVRDYIGSLKCCSKEALDRLAYFAVSESENYVALTGAITSSRYRKGPNEFFYAIRLEGHEVRGHMQLSKIDENVHNTLSFDQIRARRSQDSLYIQEYLENQLNYIVDTHL